MNFEIVNFKAKDTGEAMFDIFISDIGTIRGFRLMNNKSDDPRQNSDQWIAYPGKEFTTNNGEKRFYKHFIPACEDPEMFNHEVKERIKKKEYRMAEPKKMQNSANYSQTSNQWKKKSYEPYQGFI